MHGSTPRDRDPRSIRARWCGVPLLVLLAALLPAVAQAPGGADSLAPGPHAQVGLIQIADAIQPATADFFHRSLEWATDQGMAALIVELDTPGGLDRSMRRMVKDILSARIPVIVYVAPSGSRAASAGVFLLMAAQVAAMAPGTNVGAAHPVAIGGMPGAEPPDSTMMSKVTNDAVAYVRALAERRGRNADWAERAVRESVSASDQEALDLGVIDLIADSPQQLLEKVSGREVELAGRSERLQTAGARIVPHAMNWRDQILNTIADPNLAYLLLLLGGLGIFFELSHPGSIFPGVVGAIALFLAFFAFQMLPVRAAGIALIALGVILFILEIKVTSYGALTIGGVAALVFGSLMLYDTADTGIRLAWTVMLPSVAGVAALFIFGIVMAVRARVRRPVTGVEGLVGKIGEARSELAPAGRVFVHGEIWNAISRSPVSRGQRVRVVRVSQMTLEVEPVAEPPDSPARS